MADATMYLAKIKIHLGGSEPPSYIEKGDSVQYDGQSVRLNGSEDLIKLTNPGALKGAILKGWLVEEGSSNAEYRPKAAGVEVRSAVSSGRERDLVNVMTVQEEEQDRGTIADVRGEGAPPVHVAKDSKQIFERTSDKNAPVKKSMAVTRDTDDGVVVGRMKTSATSEAVEIGKGDDKIRSKLDNNPSVSIEKFGKATGDVQEARSGDTLEDLLPDAASAGVPEGTFKNDGVEVMSAGSSIGGAEEGVVVGKIAEAAKRVLPKDFGAALRQWVNTGETWDGEPMTQEIFKTLAKWALRKIDALSATVEADPEPEEAPAFEWDTSPHWKRRVIKANEYAGDPDTLRAILAAESSPGVLKEVNKLLGL